MVDYALNVGNAYTNKPRNILNSWRLSRDRIILQISVGILYDFKQLSIDQMNVCFGLAAA